MRSAQPEKRRANERRIEQARRRSSLSWKWMVKVGIVVFLLGARPMLLWRQPGLRLRLGLAFGSTDHWPAPAAAWLPRSCRILRFRASNDIDLWPSSRQQACADSNCSSCAGLMLRHCGNCWIHCGGRGRGCGRSRGGGEMRIGGSRAALFLEEDTAATKSHFSPTAYRRRSSAGLKLSCTQP